MMIKSMANENREAYKSNQVVMVETVKVARDWLREQMKGEWERADKSLSSLFKDEHGFRSAKGQGVGRETIMAFLGGGWKKWEIQEALGPSLLEK